MKMEACSGFVYKTHMSDSWRDWDCLDVGLRVLVARRQFLTAWEHEDLEAPHWRLYAMGGPGAWVRVRGRRKPLDPALLWLVPPETSFHSGSDCPLVQTYVHFLINPVWRPERRDFYPVAMNAEMRGRMRALEKKQDPWRTGCEMQQWILGALSQLPRDGFVPPARDPRLRHLVDQMTSDPSHPWSNPELARLVGMHPHAMVRWFKQHTGQTPRAFLLERRVQEACLRLHHSTESLDEIAASTGFCDRYHMSRVFKAYRGQGPASFRKKWAGMPALRRQNDWVS